MEGRADSLAIRLARGTADPHPVNHPRKVPVLNFNGVEALEAREEGILTHEIERLQL
jgi:hypothetical protein